MFFLFVISNYIIHGWIFKNKNFQSLDLIKNDYLIRAVGSNIKLDRFYGKVKTAETINELVELSDPNLEIKTFFIWPEGIIPNLNQSGLKDYKFIFENKFNSNHIIGLGINDYRNKDGKGKFYNSFSIYDSKINLITAYNKVNLVPFGEFLPFEKFLVRIGLKSLTNNYQSYSNGKSREIIKINQNNFSLRLLPLICYEIIYSGKIFKNHEFDYIINISEDGWFGNSIGPQQHFTHSIFRAIESGKYIIRSANNGKAAIINPIGLVEEETQFGTSGYIDFAEKRITDTTLFSTQGNKMFFNYNFTIYFFDIFI